MTAQLDPSETTLLEALAARYPTADLALSEASALRASLSFPKGIVHVVSDVHGEYKKLRHIINNASGSLRPLAESLFGGEMSSEEIQQLLAVIYYPHEAIEHWRPTLTDPERRRDWVCDICRAPARSRARASSLPRNPAISITNARRASRREDDNP